MHRALTAICCCSCTDLVIFYLSGTMQIDRRASGCENKHDTKKSAANMITDLKAAWFDRPVRPRVITIGNQKGGTGKSTLAMHIAVALMRCGYAVGTLDLDGVQKSFSAFVENRKRRSARERARGNPTLTVPAHRTVVQSAADSSADAEAEETGRVAEAFEALLDNDYLVVDTPGSDTFCSRLAHVLADTLVTPLNDSFVDLHVLVRMDEAGRRVLGPSHYCLSVIDRWGSRMSAGGQPLDWIVVRNRVSRPKTRNQIQLQEVLGELSCSLGFRLATDVRDRVVYRELFLEGLTVLDDLQRIRNRTASPSEQAAKAEIWSLLKLLGVNDMAGESLPVAKRFSRRISGRPHLPVG